MRRHGIWLAAGLLAACMPALAQSRPDTLTLSCQAVRALVAREGRVLLGTGPNVYDIYVRDASFCQNEETTRPAFLPTRDAPQCPIGFACVLKTYERTR